MKKSVLLKGMPRAGCNNLLRTFVEQTKIPVRRAVSLTLKDVDLVMGKVFYWSYHKMRSRTIPWSLVELLQRHMQLLPQADTQPLFPSKGDWTKPIEERTARYICRGKQKKGAQA